MFSDRYYTKKIKTYAIDDTFVPHGNIGMLHEYCHIDANYIANDILKSNGFEYKSKVYIHEEYFPTRVYGETVLEADVYDAIIVELGDAGGNNWWCVVYPPLCFVNNNCTNEQNIQYKLL